MFNSSARRSICSLAIVIAISVSIALMAPTPVALVLALVALPIEAHLAAAAIHGLAKPKMAKHAVR